MRDDFVQYYQAALHLALAYPGLTEAEYAIMGTIVAFDSATASELAQTISAMHDEVPNQPLYEEAVTSLIHKGYACLLDAERISSMRAEIARADIPALEFLMPTNCFHPGEVDLTPEGYLAYRDVSMKVYGSHHVYYNEAGWIDDEQGTVKVYAVLEGALDTRVGEAVLALQDEGKQIQSVQGPVPIGQWRPNRFITCPEGNCVIIAYRGRQCELCGRPGRSTHSDHYCLSLRWNAYECFPFRWGWVWRTPQIAFCALYLNYVPISSQSC